MRSFNSIRNMTVSTIAQVFSMLLSFASRTIFVKLLATEYLGLSGLFTNVLSVLSLSELGIGNAIIINLYKPLAEKDEETVCRYMNFYAKAYRAIGIFILLFGLISTPFLDYLVKTDVAIPNLRLIYFLFVANSAVSYFFAYKRTILTVDQKEYINTINRNVFLLIQHVLQIVILLMTHSYLLYVVTMLLCTFLSNLHISFLTDRRYPYLKNKDAKLDRGQKRDLVKSLKAILLHKVGGILVNSTDNIIISVLLGVYWVGLYSNYSMITGIVTTFALIIFAACSASIGNMNAVESSERVHDVFKTMTFISLWVYGFCSICFLCLFQDFISIWIGDQFLLDYVTVMLIVAAFFLKGIIGVTNTFLDVTKLFVNTRWVPLTMAVINLLVSIIATYWIGLSGVFLGTVVSYALTMLWINPLVLYKRKFNRSIWEYIVFLVPRLLIILGIGAVTYIFTCLTNSFIIKVLICGLFPNLIMYIVWQHTKEFRYLYGVLKRMISRKKNT